MFSMKNHVRDALLTVALFGTPSLAATMLSRFSTASGVSTFAMTGVGAPQAWQISRI